MDADTPPAPTVEEFLSHLPQGMGALNATMGIELVEIGPERVVATMPVQGNTQPYGLAPRRGVGSAGRDARVGRLRAARLADRLSVGVDINATTHRAVRDGVVTGTATAIHLGRRMASYEVVVTDERDRRGVYGAHHLRSCPRRQRRRLTGLSGPGSPPDPSGSRRSRS
ncbi:MAG: hotdog fold thioesterase [Nocardioides sp.]